LIHSLASVPLILVTTWRPAHYGVGAGNSPPDYPQRAGDGPRPVRAGPSLALGFWPECPQRGGHVHSAGHPRLWAQPDLCALPIALYLQPALSVWESGL